MTYEKCFDFLRFSLIKDYPTPTDLSPTDWQDLFSFGLTQALLGVFFCGLRKLPKGIAPPNGLLMQWVAMSDQIRKQNIRVNKVAGEIFQKFTNDGFRCCILKGQGNALMYDDPYSRAAGDVDIWMCGYVDDMAEGGYTYPKFKDMCKKVVAYTRQNFQVEQIRGHHACFSYKEVEVEAHFAPSERTNPIYNKRFKKWFRERAREQSENYVELPENMGRITVPTLSFNLVYQIAHLYRHFFDMGIGLRQFVDYWHLLMKHDISPQVKDQVREDLLYLGLHKFATAVAWVLERTLHIPEEKMIVTPDERRGKLLLEEIINGGNFGKFDTKYGDITHKSIGKKYFMKTYRNLSFISYYPEEALFEPFYRTYHFFLRKAKGWM